MMWFLFGLMIALALVFVLYPLIRARSISSVIDSDTANVEILKDQLAELKAEFDQGNITAEFYQQARDDLEASVAADLDYDKTASLTKTLSGKTRIALAAVIGLFLSVGSFVFYQYTSTYQPEPKVASQAAPAETRGESADQQDLPSIDVMAEMLAARLRDKPDDARGWYMLGKTYMALNRVEDAVGAYDQAYRLVGDQDSSLLTDYAEALAYANGESMLGRPTELVNSALKIEPTNAKALWLAGFAAMQNGAYVAAINHWQSLLDDPSIPDDTRQLASVYIGEAKQLAGLVDEPPAQPADTQPGASPSISVTVSLDDSLKSNVTPGETVYVFARASQGMPMPLAVQRLTVADLPATVILDDSMAMLQGNGLSAHEEVIVGARVSRAGTPMPQAGDLQGLGEVINPHKTSSQNVIIDHVVN
ncbi:MAG TPA: c-type cytochrome biogenesis protein CcmI [Gammaproteobacteria bacterium]|jgi:cytochrome c-type biogenesis protein CcmH